MTDSEKAEHKEKVRKVMLDHLTTLGYPDCDRTVIINELKNMWVKIEEAGLIVEDMNFNDFCQHANQAFTMAELQDILGI